MPTWWIFPSGVFISLYSHIPDIRQSLRPSSSNSLNLLFDWTHWFHFHDVLDSRFDVTLWLPCMFLIVDLLGLSAICIWLTFGFSVLRRNNAYSKMISSCHQLMLYNSITTFFRERYPSLMLSIVVWIRRDLRIPVYSSSGFALTSALHRSITLWLIGLGAMICWIFQSIVYGIDLLNISVNLVQQTLVYGINCFIHRVLWFVIDFFLRRVHSTHLWNWSSFGTNDGQRTEVRVALD